MSRLQNKVAVITGGTSGIGLAAAQRFVAEGAFVYIFARRQDELARTVASDGADVGNYHVEHAAIGSDLGVEAIKVLEPADVALHAGNVPADRSSPEEAAAVRAKHAASIPLGRMARPEEIAAAMLFLASEDSSFVAGSELLVDGGMCSV
jgi:NAD(P)-dependent dehydrogenase (short-subunit alcohol dehydrogenase family)